MGYYHRNRPLFFLDTSVLNPHLGSDICEKLVLALTAVQDELRYCEDVIDRLYLRRGRLSDLCLLFEKSYVIVVNSVVQEIEELIKAINRPRILMEKQGLKESFKKERGRVGENLEIYFQELTSTFKMTQGRDPTLEDFIYSNIPKISVNESTYRGVSKRAKRLLNTVVEKQETTLKKGIRYTDAEIVALAYLLNGQGYNVCVLSNDADIIDLFSGISSSDINCFRNQFKKGVMHTFVLQDRKYRIEVYSPDFM